jgi:CBS domain-containing protein
MTHVADIMNTELFHLRPEDPLGEAPGYLVSMGITAAPVLGTRGAPIGVLSLRDCLVQSGAATVADRMTRPAVTVPADADVGTAARLLAERHLHHLVAVDGHGRAVGMVSAVDVLRAQLGLPPSHPESFPHYDADTGLTWTDEVPLDMERADFAPPGPGVLLLVDGRPDAPRRVLWGEWTHELRTRIIDLVSAPQREAALTRLLAERSPLWFRAASLPDGPERHGVVEQVIQKYLRGAPFVSR